LGYWDSEHEIAKPAGTFRIAVLGDSFAEARQVAQEESEALWNWAKVRLSGHPPNGTAAADSNG
jgi:hypothetical protein